METTNSSNPREVFIKRLSPRRHKEHEVFTLYELSALWQKDIYNKLLTSAARAPSM
jgi:hypothetical protein